jgi:aryl carrier-like protein
MSNDEGVDAFLRALASPHPQVLVAPQPLSVLAQAMPANTVSPAETVSPADSVSPAATVSRADTVPPIAAGAAPRNDVERVIAQIWKEVLGVDAIGIDDNFFDLGGDSVVSLQFIARARRAGLRFTNSQVFEHQTIAALAATAKAPTSAAGAG